MPLRRIAVSSVRGSPMWRALLQHLVLPLGDLAFGQRMMRRLRFLSRAQWWDCDRIRQHRDVLLRATVRTAYDQVPFYRRLCSDAGVRPEDIRSAADLPKIPIVTKRMLRAAYPHDVTRKTGWRTYEARTSGSTGENFSVLEDTETAGWYRATLLLELAWAGWRIGEAHLQTGMNFSRGVSLRLKDTLLGCHYVSAAQLNDAALDDVLEWIAKYRIRHLWGFPGSIYLLARRAAQAGWDMPLHSVVTWGDNLYPHYRQTIEPVFGSRILDTYGCCEGMHIASQCERRDLYHIHMLDVIAEFVDDEGRPVPPDQPGNIVLTRLHPGPMPLIRYRIGDVGIRGERTCGCGRGFETMQAIQGRDSDYILTPDGNRLIVHFFTGILEHCPEIESFQVVQEEPASMTLRVVPAERFTPESAERILAQLRKGGAGRMRIRLDVVDAIPSTSTGKRRFVINELARKS